LEDGLGGEWGPLSSSRHFRTSSARSSP
jgi:hypothetical protein